MACIPQLPRGVGQLLVSAGILLFRRRACGVQVLLAHPGGPFWSNRDAGAWTLPKGTIELDEAPIEAAQREFFEEIGMKPEGPFFPLGTVTQRAGKVVHAWACEGDFDPEQLSSNLMKVIWPPNSGKWLTVPEVDRCDWFDLESAAMKINSAQAEFLLRLRKLLHAQKSNV
jgi:predicted NUDIX family NTP pyrophosphohydrolase